MTIREYLKTLLQGVKTYVDEKIVKSDWNINDENDPAFIKNRPFYTTDPVETEIVNGTFKFGEVGGPAAGLYATNDITPSAGLVEGQNIKINWDNTEYSFIVRYDEMLGIHAGNCSIYNALAGTSFEDTGEPFILGYTQLSKITIITTDSNTEHTVSIFIPLSKDIQLDRKFIPYVTGEKVEGKTYTINDEEVVAEEGAEIFNDYTNNKATGHWSHAEGWSTTASGHQSHAEGYNTTASGYTSHAEGHSTTASGDDSHAEGWSTTASGMYSHAEGLGTTASNEGSHAEGANTTASGRESHAEGGGTKASSKYQHVQGRYNIEDTENKYAHIVGNGDWNYGDYIYSNAHTVDWNGNAWYQGEVYVGGTSQDDGKQLVTKEYVDTMLGDIEALLAAI